MKSVLMRGEGVEGHSISTESSESQLEAFQRIGDINAAIEAYSNLKEKDKLPYEQHIYELLNQSVTEAGGEVIQLSALHDEIYRLFKGNLTLEQKKAKIREIVTKSQNAGFEILTENIQDSESSFEAQTLNILNKHIQYNSESEQIESVLIDGKVIPIKGEFYVNQLVRSRPFGLVITQSSKGKEVATFVASLNPGTGKFVEDFVNRKGEGKRAEILDDIAIEHPETETQSGNQIPTIPDFWNNEGEDFPELKELLNSMSNVEGKSENHDGVSPLSATTESPALSEQSAPQVENDNNTLSFEAFTAGVMAEITGESSNDPEGALKELAHEQLLQTAQENFTEQVSKYVEDALNQDPIHKLRMVVVAARQKLASYETSANPLIFGNKILDAREDLATKEEYYQDAVSALQEELKGKFEGDFVRQALQQMYVKEAILMRDVTRADIENMPKDESEGKPSRLDRAAEKLDKVASKIGQAYQMVKKLPWWGKMIATAATGVGAALLVEKGANLIENKRIEQQLSDIEQKLGDEDMTLEENSRYISILEARYRTSGKGSEKEQMLYQALLERYAFDLTQEALGEDATKVTQTRAALATLKQSCLQDQIRGGNIKKFAIVAGAVAGIATVGLGNLSKAGEFFGNMGQASETFVSAGETVGTTVSETTSAIETIQQTAEMAEFNVLSPGETVWENISGAMESMGLEASDQAVEEMVSEYFATDAGKEVMLELASQTEGGSGLLAEWGIDNATQLTPDQMMELSHFMAEGELEGLVDFVQESAQGIEEVISSGAETIDIVTPEIPEVGLVDLTETVGGEILQQLEESLGLSSDEAMLRFEDIIQTSEAQRIAYNYASLIGGVGLALLDGATSPDQLGPDVVRKLFNISPPEDVTLPIAELVDDALAQPEQEKQGPMSERDFLDKYSESIASVLESHNKGDLSVPYGWKPLQYFDFMVKNTIPNEKHIPSNFTKSLFQELFTDKQITNQLVLALRHKGTIKSQRLLEEFASSKLVSGMGGEQNDVNASALAKSIEGGNISILWRSFEALSEQGEPRRVTTSSSEGMNPALDIERFDSVLDLSGGWKATAKLVRVRAKKYIT